VHNGFVTTVFVLQNLHEKKTKISQCISCHANLTMMMGLLALASVSDGLVDNSKQTLMNPLSEYSEMAKKIGEVVHPSHCRTHTGR